MTRSPGVTEDCMSRYISDGSEGRKLHIGCDRCGRRIVLALADDGRPAVDPPPELIDWRSGTGLRDLCPDCQSRPDLPPLAIRTELRR